MSRLTGIKIILASLFLLFVFSLGYSLGHTINSEADSGVNQIASPPIKSQQSLNKSFDFPVTDTTGNVITNFTYTITSANIQDQIILKGQPATAVKGHTFLIINLKLINPSSQSLSINTRDYIRLSVNNSSDTLAPDIHNDPVILQPISTTPTRLGFTIDVSAKKLVLQIGEIKGDKTNIPIKLTH